MFLNKLNKFDKLSSKAKSKLTYAYLKDIAELRWALRVALDRYDIDHLNKAEKILAKYDNIR